MVASFDSTGSLNHIHKNHQDSTVLRTNEIGVEVFNQKYFPFGESMSGSSFLGDLNNLFTDQLYLEEMNTRGVRPLEMNVYSYVGNDPVNMVDPSGYAAETQGGSFLDTFSPSGGRLSDAFADHIGVPRGTDIYNMENAKSMNSAEFQEAMEANTFFTRELPMAAGAVVSAAVIGPIVAPTIVNTALGCAANNGCNAGAVSFVQGFLDGVTGSATPADIGPSDGNGALNIITNFVGMKLGEEVRQANE